MLPTEQIKIFLGHLPSGSDATTSIYAPYEPEFLRDAVAAIEDVMGEINTEGLVCVSFACRDEETAQATQPQAIEKIGGPGRTRTCDNTVMSGAF